MKIITKQFELAYFGGAMNRDNLPIRYQRYHPTVESAKMEHNKIMNNLMGSSFGVIYGPGCGNIGIPA